MENIVPDHVAIIMDGNRRWAKQRGLPALAGHAAGVEALEKVVTLAAKKKIKFLTVYALSAENLQERGQSELAGLFSLIQKGLVTKLDRLVKEGVKLVFLGNIKALPTLVQKALGLALERSKGGKGLQLAVALNYSSRAEIVEAAQKASSIKDLDETKFSNLLYTSPTADPDLIIRTGGQKRLSNFLLWQASYSELYFTDLLWPDFGEKDFERALEDFALRKRNFGA
ncbi:MAG TPA: polyprenyl diphosphate synthase [Candidatus Nanoarchaeia archaeon]